MAAYNKFNTFGLDLTNKVHNLGSDSLKVMLTNVAPVATNAVYADLTDLGTANGYTAGGAVATLTSNTQTSGVQKLILVDTVFTASGAVGPFRYAVLYNNTAGSKQLIAWWDYGSSISLANTDTLTIDFDGSGGVFTIT